MNQTFSLSRFGRLLYKHFSDNRGQLVTSLALLAGTLVAFALIAYAGVPFAVERNRIAMFFFTGWLAWYFFVWQQVDVLNNRERSMTYLLQPASQLEKILLIWFVSGVGFLLVYFLLVTVIDTLGVGFVNSRRWDPEQVKAIRQVNGIFTIEPFFRADGFWPPTHILVLTGLLHAFSLAGFLFVKRYALPIVSVVIMGTLVAGFFINFYTVKAMLLPAQVVNVLPLESPTITLATGTATRVVDLPQPLGNVFRYATGILGVLLLYVIAFFRLKEREV